MHPYQTLFTLNCWPDGFSSEQYTTVQSEHLYCQSTSSQQKSFFFFFVPIWQGQYGCCQGDQITLCIRVCLIRKYAKRLEQKVGCWKRTDVMIHRPSDSACLTPSLNFESLWVQCWWHRLHNYEWLIDRVCLIGHLWRRSLLISFAKWVQWVSML